MVEFFMLPVEVDRCTVEELHQYSENCTTF